jgi:hypothetical protein
MRRFFGLFVTSGVLVVVLLALYGIAAWPAQSISAAASPPAQRIGLRVLVITDSTDATTPSGTAYGDWVNTLKREGVPYTSVVTNSAWPGSVPLPALSGTLFDGTKVANYEGVVVAISGTVGLSSAQWATLQSFEQQFSVRQITAYAVPSSDYGLSAPSPAGGAALPGTTALTLTAAGSKVFPYLNAIALDSSICSTPTSPSSPCTWGYEATPLAGAKVLGTLISGPNSSSLLGIYTSADGRQIMYQTFNQNQYMLQSQLLRHGELAWLLRSTYFGDQRNYLETHIDDTFLSDDSWSVAGNATTAAHSTDFNPADALREGPADVTTSAAWSKTNNFRIDMLFNGGGSVQAANGGADPLLAQFQATDATTGKPYANNFGWVNHTWDHPNLDEGCATQGYIMAEINQNLAWGARSAAAGNPTIGGLGLTALASPTAALGNQNPNAVVTGEHAGLANLIPGNPGKVDPPLLNAATPATAGGTLATGQYVYAVSDEFNTAASGATPVAGTGESEASQSAPVSVTGPTGSVVLTWDAVCHAANYKIYRAPYTGTPPTGMIGTWSLIGTARANTASDFANPTSTSDTTGGGAVEKAFTDTGGAGSLGTPQTSGNAVESPYEQNPNLNAAFAAASNGGIKYFGSDASKPYPNPADSSFPTGSTPSKTFGAGSTFSDAGGTAIPRYPTNIYYNVSTDAQEVDEYQMLYDLPTCVPISGVTSCNPAGTKFTIAQIIASVDQPMFQHMMGNDPRPHYFHQTNLMSQKMGSVTGQGSGLFYETLNPLLTEYRQYFVGNAPIEQPTMAQIGSLLSEQAGWAAANVSQISGYIAGNVVTVNNNGAAIALPLTGTTVGSPYAGSQSGWVLAPPGTSTYTALAAWPAPPLVPPSITMPTGPAPTNGGKLPARRPKAVTKAIATTVIQVAPKTVHVKRRGKVTVSLKCRAAKGAICTGKFTLKVKGQTVSAKFRIKAGKIARITVRLPKRARATSREHHHTMQGRLVISATQGHHKKAKITTGKLTIKT